MVSTLELCDCFFGTKDLYGIFEIEKKATIAEVKKAYYKQALKVHPDRAPAGDKEHATDQFKTLAKIHEILSDDARRALYDDWGDIDDEDDDKFGSTWLETLNHNFKPISDSDIDSEPSTSNLFTSTRRRIIDSDDEPSTSNQLEPKKSRIIGSDEDDEPSTSNQLEPKKPRIIDSDEGEESSDGDDDESSDGDGIGNNNITDVQKWGEAYISLMPKGTPNDAAIFRAVQVKFPKASTEEIRKAGAHLKKRYKAAQVGGEPKFASWIANYKFRSSKPTSLIAQYNKQRCGMKKMLNQCENSKCRQEKYQGGMFCKNHRDQRNFKRNAAKRNWSDGCEEQMKYEIWMMMPSWRPHLFVVLQDEVDRIVKSCWLISALTGPKRMWASPARSGTSIGCGNIKRRRRCQGSSNRTRFRRQLCGMLPSQKWPGRSACSAVQIASTK